MLFFLYNESIFFIGRVIEVLQLVLSRNEVQRKEALDKELSVVLQQMQKRIILLVPEQSAFARDRDILLRFGAKAVSSMLICGFSRFATTLLQEAGKAVKPQIDAAGRAVLMSLAVENAAGENRLYSAHAGREKLMTNLLAARDELRQYGLQPSDLEQAAERIGGESLRRKTTELALIFEAYDALVGNRFSDKSDNINMLTELLKECNLLENAVILVDGFRGFTEQQFCCMEQVLRQCPIVTVFLCTEKNAAEDGAFSHAERTRRRLHSAAQKSSADIKEIYLADTDCTQTALSYLREALYNPYADAYEKKADAVALVAAADKYAECDFCAAEAARLLREEGYRARDIAVIERQAGSYSKSIAAAFRRHGVPCFEDMRRPLGEFPLVRLVTAACEAAGNRLQTETLMKALKTGLADLNVQEVAELEAYARLWQIEGEGWKKEFTGHPRGFGKPMEEADREKLSALEALRKRAVLPILHLRKELDCADGRTACEAVYQYLLQVKAGDRLRAFAQRLEANGDTAAAIECGRIWDVLMELLDALQEAIGVHTVGAKRFSQLLQIMISSAELGDIPDGIDEVAVGDAVRIRLQNAKAVFVVGVNDGVFPAMQSDAGIFTQSEKAQLREVDLLLGESPENACAEERLLAYCVLTAASERLYVSYSESDLHARTQHKSEIVQSLEKIYPQCRRVNTATLSVFDKISSAQTAFESAAERFTDNTPLSSSLVAFVKEKERYADRLLAVERAAAGRKFVFEDPESAKALFGEKLYLSPTKIETYHKCSFAYFCRYGLKLEPPFAAKLDPSNRGLLIHEVLEKLLDQNRNGVLSQLTDVQLREQIHVLCESYIEEYMGGRENMPLRLQWQLDRAEQTAFEIAQRLRAEFGTSLFVTKDVELPIRENGDVAPFTVRTPDGGSVYVTGMIDRVDVMEADGKSYVRVVDYKTGGKNFKLSDINAGLNMQMLLYLMCLWDNAKERYGDIVPAGILYVPAKTGTLTLPRNATVDEIERQKIKNGRMNGLVLAEKQVILGMDSTGAGVYINAEIDKKGELKGSIASLDEFVRIHEKIESILCEMYADLQDGSIHALPIDGTNYKDICRYCDYANVCCHESTDAVRNLDVTGEGDAQ